MNIKNVSQIAVAVSLILAIGCKKDGATPSEPQMNSEAQSQEVETPNLDDYKATSPQEATPSEEPANAMEDESDSDSDNMEE